MMDNDLSVLKYLRVPHKLRTEFDYLLRGFEDKYTLELLDYAQFINESIKNVLYTRNTPDFLRQFNIEAVAWYYRTRHPSGGKYFWIQSLEVVKGNVESYRASDFSIRKRRSPFHKMYGNEQAREGSGKGGPLAIILTNETSDIDKIDQDWKNRSLILLEKDVKFLLNLKYQNEIRRLSNRDLLKQFSKNRSLIKKIRVWLENAGVDLENDLPKVFYDSIKLALSNLGQQGRLPISIFFCPTNISGEEIGSFTFLLRGIPSRYLALVCEQFTVNVLDRIRLKEDSMSYSKNEDLIKLDQLRKFYMARLSHNLRHPLDTLSNTVSSFSESFRLLNEQFNYLSTMMDQTILAVQTNRTTDVIKPNKVEDRVVQFLRDLRHYFRSSFKVADKELRVRTVDKNWFFSIDRGIMYEVMENLVNNALEHGGELVEIFVERNNESYILHVRDNGSGIPKELKGNLFKPIVSYSFDEESGQRGLGLSLTKMLVEAHGGKLSAEYPRGWGVDFVIELPRS